MAAALGSTAGGVGAGRCGGTLGLGEGAGWARGRRSQGCVVFCLWDGGVGKESMVALSTSVCAGVVAPRSSGGRWGGELAIVGDDDGTMMMRGEREELCQGPISAGKVLPAKRSL